MVAASTIRRSARFGRGSRLSLRLHQRRRRTGVPPRRVFIDYGGASAEIDTADSKPADTKPAAAAPSPVAKDEIIVGLARIDEATGRELEMKLLGEAGQLGLDPYSWRTSRSSDFAYWMTTDDDRREKAIALREEFWTRRHAWAKTEAAKWPAIEVPAKSPNPIDAFINAKIAKLNIKPASLVDDAAFLRRAALRLRRPEPDLARVANVLRRCEPGSPHETRRSLARLPRLCRELGR